MNEELQKRIPEVIDYVNQAKEPLSWFDLAEKFGHGYITKSVSSDFHNLIWLLVSDGRVCLDKNNQIIKGDGLDHLYP